MIPADGVYAVWADAADARRAAVANVGARPTFPEAGRAIEVHVLDFEGDLVGQMVRVHLVQRLRAQKPLGSQEALAEQIGRDVEAARGILG
jgi:riboflavin kinase/FMN adenylyltransferase